ncbi:maleylpyruvate isomerase family mycothiol-dependent enzyme [Streptomyces sp. x-80]|jgi:uncharacterized protein (TIGR03083 family)|uniref:maleylpyruvate isomerase family mycothiol-dependent enzyme n=1 Tax=Streptomyces sp. x-80 TaxID=2789282 RepID=UPI00398067D8
MTTTPPFSGLLALVAGRSAALRTAVAGATGLDARVPGCPGWSLFDLVAHVGKVQRFWAAVVAAGPATRPPADEAAGSAAPRDALLAWSAEGTGRLLTALREAGPERGCWAWWGASGVPLTAGAVARHQVQEAAVHAYDAQAAAGRPRPLPEAVAVDGVAEFLAVSFGTAGRWPHRPARVAWYTAEGPSWSVGLTAEGAVISGMSGPATAAPAPTAAVYGPASDLLLTLYGRRTLDGIRVDGDRAPVEELIAWPSPA